MTIYYFSGDIIREGIPLGNFKKEFFQSKEELISAMENFIEKLKKEIFKNSLQIVH